MNREQLLAHIAQLKESLGTLSRMESLSDEDATRAESELAELETAERQLAEMDAADAKIAAARDRLADLAQRGAFQTVSGDGAGASPEFLRKPEQKSAYEVLGTRSGSLDVVTREHVDCARRYLDQSLGDNAERRENAEALLMGRIELGADEVRTDLRLRAAEQILSRATPEYERAFVKVISGRQWAMERDEHVAMERAAMAVGASATGGVMVPTHLDPTVILTNNGAVNGMGAMARRVTLVQGNVWNGVTSGGITAAYSGANQGEAVEAGDDTPAFAGKGISVHRADIYAQASFEAVQDIGDLEGNLQMLANDALSILHAEKWITGTGTNEPWGLVTRLDATAASEVATDTAATLATTDIYDLLYKELPVRWQDRAAWLMHSAIMAKIRQFGTTDANFTVNMSGGNPRQLLGLRAEFASAMASVTTTGSNLIVLGDPMAYVIVTKLGTELHRIPLVMGANRRPTGETGWFWVLRDGADVSHPQAFRLLKAA